MCSQSLGQECRHYALYRRAALELQLFECDTLHCIALHCIAHCRHYTMYERASGNAFNLSLQAVKYSTIENALMCLFHSYFLYRPLLLSWLWSTIHCRMVGERTEDISLLDLTKFHTFFVNVGISLSNQVKPSRTK